MGIAGLLPQLRSITRRAHVSKYRGQTMAVDAYCLLHRGSYSCARELVEGEPTERHVQYCMGRVELLLAAGVRPIVVFDGGRLPNKADEERSRERSREENKARARALWAQGNKAAAMECYQKAVDIQPAHAKQFVEALKQRNIPYIVAPYEADAQMAYLALNNLVDAVLTEDSDLLCYGCPTVFFKMDKGGEGEEVRLADLPAARELAFQGFGHELFQEMCVLAGCDFVASLPGIGIKKAHQHLRRTRCFLKVVRALRFDGVKIPEGYERRVQRALWTFKHQRVYCPSRRAAVHLHEVAGGELAAGARVPAAAQLEEGEPDFLGPPLPDDVAQAIAVGDLDPITKLPFGDELQPCTAPLAADAAASGCGAAAGQRAAPSGRQQRGSGRGKSGGQQGRPAAASGGPILKYVLRGLTKPSTSADFKAPRVQQQVGSQGSQEQQSVAGTSGPGLQQRQQEEEEEEVQSPVAVRQPATVAADTLASPTEEQWAQFRRRQRKGSGRAPAAATVPATALALSSAAAGPAEAGLPPPPVAAAAAAADDVGPAPAAAARRVGAGATTSKYFRPFGGAPLGGLRHPAARPQTGGLMATLRAALQGEPSVEQLLSEQAAEADLDPAADSGDEGGAGTALQQRQGGGRPRLVVPNRQAQQQQPSVLQALGLRSSPTIDDLLDGSSADTGEDEEQELPSLRCSPAAEAPAASQRPSQRAWLPQRAAAMQQAAAAPQEQAAAQRRQQAQQDLLDLISPRGPAFLQQQEQQQEPDAGGGGITPGFYGGSGSEAGSGARLLTSLPRRPPVATPGSASPAFQGFCRQPQLGSAAPRRRSTAAEEEGVGGGDASPSFSGDGDPIASLSHVAAFQPKAEAAVERAAAAALAATAQTAFPPLPPPPRHLRHGIAAGPAADSDEEAGHPASTPAAGKRPLLEKENRLLQAARSKRPKDGGSSAAPGSNPFAGFALL